MNKDEFDETWGRIHAEREAALNQAYEQDENPNEAAWAELREQREKSYQAAYEKALAKVG